MKFFIYSIYDAYTGYMQPTFEINDQVAVRNFAHAVRMEKSILSSHPECFRLDRIGVYDSDTGRILSSDNIEPLVTASSILTSDGGDN